MEKTIINYSQTIDKVKSATIPRCSMVLEYLPGKLWKKLYNSITLEKCGPAALPQMEDLRTFQAPSF